MARSRQEIIDSLFEQAEADPILSSVSRSLVGKELTYFGGNVLYQVESMGDAISRFSDIARADFQQLIAFAYTNDVPCDTVKPATVRILLHLDKVTVYPPFSIRMEVGGLRFYNIDFVRSDSQITLYQGNPCAMTSRSNSDDESLLDVFGLDSAGVIGTYKTWRLYKEFKDGKYQSSYVKLGVSTVSDSVRVFARQLGGSQGLYEVDENQPVFPYTEFNQSLSSPEAKLYKVRTGWDKSVNVLFGDDNWSTMINQDQYQYEIYWLEATTSNYNLKASNPIILGYDGDPNQKTITKDASKGDYYSVTAYTLAESDSLSYAKSFVQTKKFLQQGLVTEPQISAYVDSLPAVNSSRISTDRGANTVTVTVKPSDPEDVYFGFLEDYLSQYGVDGTTYVVVVATPLDFNVSLSAINQSGLTELNRARQIVSEYCSYDNLTINTMVSTAILNQKLQQSGIFNVSAKIVVKAEAVNPDVNQSQKLQAQPQINTIRQYNKEGQIVAFDSDGVYRQRSVLPGIDVSQAVISAVGDFFFVCQGTPSSMGSSYLLKKDQSFILSVDATNILVDTEGKPIFGKFFEYYEDNIPFLRKREDGKYSILRYATSSVFEDGDTSIFNRLTTIRPIGSEELIALDSPYKVVEDGSFAIVNSQLFLNLDSGSGSTHQYQLGRFIFKDGVWALNGIVSISAATDPRRLKFTVVDKTLIVPTDFSGDSESGGASWVAYDFFNTVSGKQDQGTVKFQNGQRTIPAGIIFSGNFVYILNKDTNATSVQQCSYRFASNQKTLQLLLQTSQVYTGTVLPDNLLKVDSSEMLYLSNDTTIWRNTVNLQQPGLPINNSYIFTSDGSVDYETGTIYGIKTYGDGDYIDYTVAGTLSGTSVYPRYIPTDE